MKISVFMLLFTLVVFLDSVHSIGPAPQRPPPSPVQGTLPPRRRIALREGDIVVRDKDFIGRYYVIGRIGLFYKIDAATLEPVKWNGQKVVITKEYFHRDDALIRNKIWWGTWNEDGFYEIPEHQRRQVIP